VFKKLMVALMTLALMVGMVLPASASVNITGSLRFRINAYNFTNPADPDFEGRLYLTLSGNVNDYITYSVGLKIGDVDLEWWKTPVDFTNSKATASLTVDKAVLTTDLTTKGIPVKIEAGALSISTYSPLTIYSDSFDIGGSGGFNIISSALFPGLTTWLLLVPDVTADNWNNINTKAFALGANLDGSWGRVTGIVWTRDDKTSTGYRVSGKWNVVPNLLTLYALYGQRAGDTEAKYQVVGINLPGVKTDTGWDPYLEYDVYNKALGFYAGKTLTTNVSTSIYIWQDASTKDLKFTPYLTFSF